MDHRWWNVNISNLKHCVSLYQQAIEDLQMEEEKVNQLTKVNTKLLMQAEDVSSNLQHTVQYSPPVWIVLKTCLNLQVNWLLFIQFYICGQKVCE